MAKQKEKWNEERLTRSVLLGLATTTAMMSFGGTASATTLSEYKAQLMSQAATVDEKHESKKADAVNVDLSAMKSGSDNDVILTKAIASTSSSGSALLTSPVNAAGNVFSADKATEWAVSATGTEGMTYTWKKNPTIPGAAYEFSWTRIAVEDGVKAKPTTFIIGTQNNSYELGYLIHTEDCYNTDAENMEKPINSTADLTEVIFKIIPAIGSHQARDKDHSSRNCIDIVNGTTLVKASNLYGAAKNSFNIGESAAEYLGTDPNHQLIPATLKLVGNEKFNSVWTTDSGVTVNGSNFIVIKDSGTLEANSAQIFTVGLGKNGDIMSPKSIRVDADNAIYFESGVLLLDDEKYNQAYLDEANKLVKAADGGTTVVEVKQTATKVEGNPNAERDNTDDSSYNNIIEKSDSVARDISDVPDGSWFGPVISNKTDIVISDAEDADSNVDKLNAKSLDLAEPSVGTANTITVDGKTFALGSSTEGQELLTTRGKKPALPVIMKILNGGILRLGTGKAANNVYADITLGDGTANDNATLNVAAGIKTINSLVANMGSRVIVAAQAMLNSPKVTFNGATVILDGILNVSGTAVFGQNSVIYVGSAETAGKMIVSGDISSTGAAIFLDPVWKDGAEITDASQLAVSDTTIDYNLVVGRNSVASIGTTDTTKLQQAFTETQLKWGEDDTTAALYLAKPATLTSGLGLTVDGALSDYTAPIADTVTFADDSLLMVDAEALKGAAALTAASGIGTLSVDDTAKLYLTNAQAGDTYTLVNGFSNTTNAKGWYSNTDNVIVNKLLKVNSTGNTAAVIKNSDSAVLKNCAIPNVVGAVVDKKALTTREGTEKYSAGANYVAMAANGLLTDKQSIALLNNAAQAAETTGASANALGMVTTFSEEAQNHLSFMSQMQSQENTKAMENEKKVIMGAPFADGDKETQPVMELHMSDKDKSIKQIVREVADKESNNNKIVEDKGYIWAKAVHEQGKIDGRELAGTNNVTNYDNRFSGITVGFDFVKKDNYEQGLAVSYGSGSASANGVNERDKYQGGGISYYGSIKKGDNNLLFDAGAYQVKHDVQGLIEADPKTNMFTLGVTEEYRKPVGNGGIFVPHIGVRYAYMDTPAYNGTYNGRTAFHYAPQKNHVFTVPVGIGYIYKYNTHGWKYNLFADLSYIGVLGGQSANMDVTIPGLGAVDSVSYDVIDQSAVKATLGFAGENERIKWGVNYSFKGSSNEKTHRVSAGISWKF